MLISTSRAATRLHLWFVRSPPRAFLFQCRAAVHFDAGADTSSAVRLADATGEVNFHGTPLDVTTRYLREKKIEEEATQQEQFHAWEAIRRLLLRVDGCGSFSTLALAERRSFWDPRRCRRYRRQGVNSTALAANLPMFEARGEDAGRC